MRTVYAYMKCLEIVAVKGGKESDSMMQEKEYMFFNDCQLNWVQESEKSDGDQQEPIFLNNVDITDGSRMIHLGRVKVNEREVEVGYTNSL